MKQNRKTETKIIYQMDQREQKLTGVLWDLYVLFLIEAGWIRYLTHWMQLERREELLLVGTAIGSCLICVLFSRIREKRLPGGLLLGGIAVFLVFIQGVSSAFYGFFGFINYLIGWWNRKKEDGIPLLYETQITREDILVFSVLLLLLLTWVNWELIRHSHLIGMFFLILACILTGFVLDCYSLAGFSALLSGWLGIWLAKIRKKPSGRRLLWIVGISVVLFAMASWMDQSPVSAMVSLKKSVTEGIDQIRYGKDTLPQGNLTKADQLLSGSDETLRVTMQTGKDMYLRGFVGGRYRDGVWEELPEASYKEENSGMLGWLKDAGFVPQNQYAAYVQSGGQGLMQENILQQLQIEVLGANRAYIYTPYSVCAFTENGVQADKDGGYHATGFFGKRSYQYTEQSSDRPGELLHAQSWILSPQTGKQQQYVNAESIYADFVYQHYLDVDDAMAQMIQSVFYPDHEWQTEHTIYEVTQQIRDVLENRVVYRKKPETMPEGTDPVSWFLNKGRQGNSVLYASAAVEAFRVQGIPARYVEGYCIRNVYDTDVTVTLTNQDSHAWVEVYLDGVGWVPVDVTPGFYYDTYTLLQMVQMPQNVNQTAAEESSSESGNEIENETDASNPGGSDPEKNRVIVIPLFLLAYLVLAAAIVIALLEFCYFINILSMEKKYRRFTFPERAVFLEQQVYELLRLYGYPAEPGWKVTEIDRQLAERFRIFAPGTYIRVSEIIEKHIYGQNTLAAYELRVIENFVQGLYDVRSQTDRRTRRKIRLWLCHRK